MSTMASQITSLTSVYSTVCSFAHQRKHQSSASLAFVRGIHRWPVNSLHKGQWRGKCFHLMTSSRFDKWKFFYLQIARMATFSTRVYVISSRWWVVPSHTCRRIVAIHAEIYDNKMFVHCQDCPRMNFMADTFVTTLIADRYWYKMRVWWC